MTGCFPCRQGFPSCSSDADSYVLDLESMRYELAVGGTGGGLRSGEGPDDYLAAWGPGWSTSPEAIIKPERNEVSESSVEPRKIWIQRLRRWLSLLGGAALFAASVFFWRAATNDADKTSSGMTPVGQVAVSASVRDLWAELYGPATQLESLWDSAYREGSVLAFVDAAQGDANELARLVRLHEVDSPPILRPAYAIASDVADKTKQLRVIHQSFRNASVDETLSRSFGDPSGAVGAESRADELLAQRDTILYELEDLIPSLTAELSTVIDQI